MEHETVVLSDLEFECLVQQPGYYTGYLPGVLARVAAGVSWTIYQKSHWDKTQAILRIVRARKDWDCAGEIRERMDKGALLAAREDRLFGLHPGWTGALLTAREVEVYADAEERILDCRQRQRELIKVGGVRLNLWLANDAACGEYLRAFDVLARDDIDGPFIRNGVLTHRDLNGATDIVMSKYEDILQALHSDEIELFCDLGGRIKEADAAQLDLFGIAGARWVDAHPEETENA